MKLNKIMLVMVVMLISGIVMVYGYIENLLLCNFLCNVQGGSFNKDCGGV